MAKKTLGVMIDCSRNAVMKTEKVKEFAKIISDMGYNMLQLYTEDTYEIEGEPYFGHMRGRYSKEELKDMDAYCRNIGVELVPCIQVLAHLNQLTQWDTYTSLFDCNDILLVGDERVYTLIDKMFATIAECFTSRRVNIGMDEAHFLGRGRYFDLHGFRDHAEILAEHMEKVKRIADKYGFSIMMWSDMFFRFFNNGEYFRRDLCVPQEAIDLVPEGVELIYWDYFGKEKEYYDDMFAAHFKFQNSIGFAGGGHTWMGFAPNSAFALETTEAALRSIREKQVNTFFMTLWGDCGKDCSYFSVLPVLFATAKMWHGNYDKADIAKQFEETYGYTFQEFMNLELPNITKEEPTHYHNPCKYLLYSDPFIGVYDFSVRSDLSERYKRAAETLEKSINGRKYDYIFTLEKKLLDVLIRKGDLGVRLRKAYQADDRATLKAILEEDFPAIRRDLPLFYEAFREMWLLENKPFGLEIQEMRFGGMLYRITCCEKRLQAYLNSELDKIDELEEKCLAKFQGYEEEAVAQNHWQSAYSASVM